MRIIIVKSDVPESNKIIILGEIWVNRRSGFVQLIILLYGNTNLPG
jgi:hypothetical protein